MKRYYIIEDKLPRKLLVKFSATIYKQINSIAYFNRNNIEVLSQWYDYLNGIKTYLSNPSIIWDNTGRYIQWQNGARFINDFGYNVAYSIVNDTTTNKNFVYVFKVNLALEEFDLKVPPLLTENKHIVRLTDSDLKFIITECVRRVIRDIYSKKLHINTNNPYKANLRNII